MVIKPTALLLKFMAKLSSVLKPTNGKSEAGHVLVVRPAVSFVPIPAPLPATEEEVKPEPVAVVAAEQVVEVKPEPVAVVKPELTLMETFSPPALLRE